MPQGHTCRPLDVSKAPRTEVQELRRAYSVQATRKPPARIKPLSPGKLRNWHFEVGVHKFRMDSVNKYDVNALDKNRWDLIGPRHMHMRVNPLSPKSLFKWNTQSEMHRVRFDHARFIRKNPYKWGMLHPGCYTRFNNKPQLYAS